LTAYSLYAAHYMLLPVRLSACHTSGSCQKRLKLGSWNFHHMVVQPGCQTREGCGKQVIF